MFLFWLFSEAVKGGVSAIELLNDSSFYELQSVVARGGEVAIEWLGGNPEKSAGGRLISALMSAGFFGGAENDVFWELLEKGGKEVKAQALVQLGVGGGVGVGVGVGVGEGHEELVRELVRDEESTPMFRLAEFCGTNFGFVGEAMKRIAEMGENGVVGKDVQFCREVLRGSESSEIAAALVPKLSQNENESEEFVNLIGDLVRFYRGELNQTFDNLVTRLISHPTPNSYFLSCVCDGGSAEQKVSERSERALRKTSIKSILAMNQHPRNCYRRPHQLLS